MSLCSNAAGFLSKLVPGSRKFVTIKFGPGCCVAQLVCRRRGKIYKECVDILYLSAEQVLQGKQAKVWFSLFFFPPRL